MENRPRALRQLLARPGIIRSMGVHDVLTAMLLERIGFECLFLGGFSTSASLLGLPDLNFIGLAEMADALRRMAGRISIPLIADGDTGHGDLHNVVRTVREIEAAGAAAVILEDQVFPKRCGHFEGKKVIAAEEMVLKLKAALGARVAPDLVVVARTDAAAPCGLDEAIDRANRYCEAGADVACVEAPLSRRDLEEIARRVRHPKLVNMLSFGKTPLLPASELEAMGYKLVVAPIETLLAAAKTVREIGAAFLRQGHLRGHEERMMSLEEIKGVLGVEEFLSLREKIV